LTTPEPESIVSLQGPSECIKKPHPVVCIHGMRTQICWLCCPNVLTNPELGASSSKFQRPSSRSSDDNSSDDSSYNRSDNNSDSNDSDYDEPQRVAEAKRPVYRRGSDRPRPIKRRKAVRKPHAGQGNLLKPSGFVTLHTELPIYFMEGSKEHPRLSVSKEMLQQIVDTDVRCVGWCEWIEGVDEDIKGKKIPSLRRACVGLRAHVGKPIPSGSVNAYTQLRYEKHGTLDQMRKNGKYSIMFN
jgi:hypothetical protein